MVGVADGGANLVERILHGSVHFQSVRWQGFFCGLALIGARTRISSIPFLRGLCLSFRLVRTSCTVQDLGSSSNCLSLRGRLLVRLRSKSCCCTPGGMG